MSVWLREFVGWLLLGSGLAVFYLAYEKVLERRIVEVIPLCFIGYVVFRGGLHLIKVATAARACRQAVVQTKAASRSVPERSRAKAGASVIPGESR